jgi:twitching motility protein PilU
MLSQLANNLIGVVSQRLVPRSSGEGLVAVAEVLRATPRVRDLLRRNELVSLKKAMEDDVQVGMQTFDQALYELYKAGLITAETALLAADSVNDLKLRLRGFGAASVE